MNFNERITEAIQQLAKISTFLTEIKYKFNENCLNIETQKPFNTFIERLFSSNEEKIIDNEKERAEKINSLKQSENGISTTKEDEMLNIPGICIGNKPRKDGRWQGYIVENGIKYYVYGRVKDDVKFKIKYLLKNGIPKKNNSCAFNKVPVTFNSFCKYYFENFRKKIVSEDTFKADMSRFKNYLLPCFGERMIKKISPLDCQNLIEKIQLSGKGKTADEIFSLLSIIFKIAIKHGIIKHNPLDIIFHQTHERKHGKALTKSEEKRFRDALIGSECETALMISLYTGLRPNELRSIRIEDNIIIAINSKRKNRKVEYKRIPISTMLAPYLRSDITIPSYEKLRLKVKEILPNHILYDLRTTFYSRCKECNISEYAICEFMGHSLGAVANSYTDLSNEYLIKEMQRFTYDLSDF